MPGPATMLGRSIHIESDRLCASQYRHTEVDYRCYAPRPVAQPAALPRWPLRCQVE
ncbi:MAG: hypothetical protein JWN68_3064 [Nocardioides sp.]|jgi:hypothetical protein|nr:hypothetical protein [Nocardioides sp.]